MVMLAACVVNNKVIAQDLGVEQNPDGSYTLYLQNGSLTTNTNGSYTAGGDGSCGGCMPPVTVYGYKKSGTSNEYTYTSYYYNNQYYNLPPDPYSPPPTGYTAGVPPQTVIVTPNQAPPPPINDPCKGYSSSTPTPANINLQGYAGAVSSLTSTLGTSLVENSMFLGVNIAAGGGLMTTTITPGSCGESNGNPTYPGFLPFASAHTHPGNSICNTYPMPSVGDIYSLATWNAQYPSYTTAYVISGSDGSTTALVVTDAQKLATFLAAYPEGTCRVGADWAPGSELANAVDAAATILDSNPPVIGSPANEAALRAAQAYVLDKFDTGLTMVMKNADGTFSQVHYVKVTDAQGNVFYKKYNCN